MYGAHKLKDTEDKAQEKLWYKKGFEQAKIYADRGDPDAMSLLSDYYQALTCGEEYRDYLKYFYWSICALDAGNPVGASDVASCYTYGYGVEKDTIFALAWNARYCIEAEKKKWPVEEYLSYKRRHTLKLRAGGTELM